MSAEREPSTGSTSTPPATPTYARRPSADRPDDDLLSRLHDEGAAVLDVLTVDVDRPDAAGDGEPVVGLGAQPQSAAEDLEHGRLGRVAQQRVQLTHGRPVERPGRADALGAEPRAAGVLHQRQGSGIDDEEAHVATTKRTWAPGARSAGGSRSTSNITASVRPISCQPPGDDRG